MTLRVTARQLQTYGIFRKHGMHKKGAAAPTGNFVQESGVNLDSTMYRAHPDASGGIRQDLKSGGIAEWLGDRKLSCIAFSRAKEARLGLPRDFLLNDLETQCEFVVHELKFGESGSNPSQYEELWRQLTTETLDSFGRPRSIATLTANFMTMYERPKMGAGTDKLGEVRIPYAEAVADRYELIEETGEPKPKPVPPTPIPQVPGPVPHPPMPTVPAGPSMSASTAGRQAAEQNIIGTTLANLFAERDSIDAEIAVWESARDALTKLSPVPAIDAPVPALPRPANPAVFLSQQRTLQMNPMILSLLRNALVFAGGAAVTNGWIDSETMQTIGGGVVAAATAGWSMWTRRQAGIIRAAAALPAVQQIVTIPAIANSPEFAMNPVVVPSDRRH